MDCTKEAKCQQTHKRRVRGKSDVFERLRQTTACWMCISQSQSNHILCVRVYTTWKYKFFQGPLPPKTPIFFFERQRERKSVFVLFFFSFLGQTSATLRLYIVRGMWEKHILAERWVKYLKRRSKAELCATRSGSVSSFERLFCNRLFSSRQKRMVTKTLRCTPWPVIIMLARFSETGVHSAAFFFLLRGGRGNLQHFSPPQTVSFFGLVQILFSKCLPE